MYVPGIEQRVHRSSPGPYAPARSEFQAGPQSWDFAAGTVLDVPNYNFHYQKAYNLAKPIHVTAGEPLQVTCTYDRRWSRNAHPAQGPAPLRHLGRWLVG